MFDITNYNLIYTTETEEFAAEILKSELKNRSTKIKNNENAFSIIFKESSAQSKDSYKINLCDNSLTISALGIRGLIYGIGRLLRKLEFTDKIILIEDISGTYSPFMKIRGHQLGWRTTANSYEAWTTDKYIQYIKELMFFGANTFEHVVFNENTPQNPLMKYKSLKDFATEVGKKAEKLDIDVSFWCPHYEAPQNDLEDLFKSVPRADVYFPPSSDPGDYGAKESLDLTKKVASIIKKHHPNIKVYPSAQSPDGFGKWGDDFIAEMEKFPPEIDGIITGPNCAMPLHDLRQRLPIQYPIRLYPDITHNVRCEYPVHFDRDDWHYALASTLSREAINPRPTEYRAIHRLTRQYVLGSVSYSEGINDDINKFVWSDMDFNPDADLTETLEDYARLFFPSADTKKAVNGILGLEKNWEGDPKENPHIETTHTFFTEMLSENPELYDNARFLMCLFRSKCDLLVKTRRNFELDLIKSAKYYLENMLFKKAKEILNTPFTADYNSLRNEIEEIGKLLFEKVGLQLDVERYYANGWERGATLDTIDNPVTDKLYLLNRIEYTETLSESERKCFVERLLNRCKTNPSEYYFSFAENSFTELGIPQEPYFYMDFQGDRPNINNGTIPMCMLKVFDHYTFKMKTGGLTGKNYNLFLNIKPRYRDEVTDFTIKINGKILYKGKQYGGTRDTQLEIESGAPGFEVHVYSIPDEFIINGCIELTIEEPKVGIMLSEIFIKQDKGCYIGD